VALSDRPVPLLASPDPRWPAAFARIVADGGIAAPLSPAYPPLELGWFVEDLDADVIVVSDDLAPLARPLAAGRRLVRLGEAAAGDPPPPWAGRASDPALILYTSGTTGRPKGAVITRGNLEVQTRVLASAWALAGADRVLHALPLHHLHGLVVAMLAPLRAGARMSFLPRFEAGRVIEALASGTTVWMAVPTMYHRLRKLAERDPAAARRLADAAAGLRLATSGSAPLPIGLGSWWATLHGALPLERYGMTEIGIALANPLERARRRSGSVGLALPTVEIKIRDGDGGGDGDPDGNRDGPGELLVRGPSVFAGYWSRPARAGLPATDPDGWFATGDRAERAPDGHVKLLGRISTDILKCAGYKISALEIEVALREHPAVDDVAVVGLPDAALGDRVIAAVVVRHGAEASGEVLREFCRERLAAYKVPRAFELVDALPRNPLGKILKPALVRALSRPGQGGAGE
jgi:malonyl-CoA/methylmalonyl-CoA synthetase